MHEPEAGCACHASTRTNPWLDVLFRRTTSSSVFGNWLDCKHGDHHCLCPISCPCVLAGTITTKFWFAKHGAMLLWYPLTLLGGAQPQELQQLSGRAPTVYTQQTLCCRSAVVRAPGSRHHARIHCGQPGSDTNLKPAHALTCRCECGLLQGTFFAGRHFCGGHSSVTSRACSPSRAACTSRAQLYAALETALVNRHLCGVAPPPKHDVKRRKWLMAPRAGAHGARRGASNGADTQRSATTSVASSSSATRTARADPGSSPPSSKGSTQGALVAKSSNGSLVSTKGSVVDASESPPQTASTRALRRAMTAGASLRASSSFGRLRPTTSHARLRAQRRLARTESALTVNAGGDTLSGASLRARRQRNRPATTAAQRSTVAWIGPQHPSVHRARGSTMGQRTGSPDSRGHPAHSLASTGDHRVSVTQLSTLDKYDFLSPTIPFAAAARRQRDTKLRGSGSEASLPYSPLKPSGASVSHNQVALPRPRTHSSIRPPVNLHSRPSSAATASPVKSRWPATSSSGHSSPEVVTRGVSSKQSSSKATKCVRNVKSYCVAPWLTPLHVAGTTTSHHLRRRIRHSTASWRDTRHRTMRGLTLLG